MSERRRDKNQCGVWFLQARLKMKRESLALCLLDIALSNERTDENCPLYSVHDDSRGFFLVAIDCSRTVIHNKVVVINDTMPQCSDQPPFHSQTCPCSPHHLSPTSSRHSFAMPVFRLSSRQTCSKGSWSPTSRSRDRLELQTWVYLYHWAPLMLKIARPRHAPAKTASVQQQRLRPCGSR